MAKRIQPKLNMPKDHVIQTALFDGCWSQADNLLRILHLSPNTVVYSSQERIDKAAEAAALLHDYIALLGMPHHLVAVIDATIKLNPNYAPYRAAALDLVAEMDRCVALPKGRAA